MEPLMPPHLTKWPGDDHPDKYADVLFERVRWLLANGYDDPDEWPTVLAKSQEANQMHYWAGSTLDLERFTVEAPTVGLLLSHRR